MQNKNVSVILSFSGAAESGFSIDVKVCKDHRPVKELNGQKIPAVPELGGLYEEWRKHHVGYGRSISRLELPNAQVEYSSADECLQSADSLVSYLNANWFSGDKFQFVKEWIRSRTLLKEDNSVPVFFEFKTDSPEQDILLRRLPWPSWDLFMELPNTEPVLGMTVGEPANPLIENIRVLIVLGSDEGGLDLEADREFVLTLSEVGAQVKCLSCPDPEELYSELKKNPYDVFFFAGHSLSEEDQRGGTILLKPGTRVPIDTLLESLRTAATKGLRLAIFNSCDGLGLANTLLKNAQIPSVLVFREPVPDEVARKFLQCFLEEFSSGKPLFLSVREARNRLRFLETRSANPLPSASWLPVVCQNYSQPEIVLRPSKPRNWSLLVSNFAKAVGAVGAISLIGIAGYFLVQLGNRGQINTNEVDGVYSIGEERLFGRREISSEAEQTLEGAHRKFADENYVGAARDLIKAINQISSDSESGAGIDPELIIYLNNAIAKMRSKEVITLGVSVPSSDLNQADEILRGVAHAQSRVCGVEEIKQSLESDTLPDCSDAPELFVVKLSDHRFHGEENSSVAGTIQGLASDQSVLGIVSRLTSGASFFVEENILSDEEIVLVSPTSTAVRNPEGNAPTGFLFRPSSLNPVGARNLASFIQAETNANILVIWERGKAYSESMKESIENALDGSNAQISECDISNENTFNVSQCFRDISAEEIDVLLAIPSGNDDSLSRAIQIISAFKDEPGNDNNDYKLLGGDPFYDPDLAEKFGDALNGMVIPLPWHRHDEPRLFENESEVLWGTRSINWRTAMAYDSGQMLIQAMGRLSCGEPTECRLALRDVLSSQTPTRGASGNLYFDDNGDRTLSPEEIGDFRDNIGVLVEFDHETFGYKRI